MAISNDKLQIQYFSTVIDNIEFQKKYAFQIILPTTLLISQYNGTLTTKSSSDINPLIYCTSKVAFPTSTTDVRKVPYYNSEIKIANKTTYNNWSASFNFAINHPIASDCDVYSYFDFWRNSVYWEKKRISSIPITYKQEIQLILLNDQFKPSGGFKLENAWPATITGDEFAFASDGITSFTVDFCYDRFVYLPII